MIRYTSLTLFNLPLCFHRSFGCSLHALKCAMASFQSILSNHAFYPTAGLQVAAEKLGLASSTFSHPESRATPPVEVNSATGEIDLTKGSNGAAVSKEEVLPVETTANEVGGEQQISAADYNPDEDRKVDEGRRQSHAPHKASGVKQEDIASGLGEPVVMAVDEESEYEEVEIDAEEDEDFDMFAMEEAPKKKTVRRKIQASLICFCGHAERIADDKRFPLVESQQAYQGACANQANCCTTSRQLR